MWWRIRMEKVKWPEKVTNEKDPKLIGQKRMPVNNILNRKVLYLTYPHKTLPSLWGH